MRLEHQRGNVFFLILVAIALFAALSATVVKSGKGGKMMSPEKAKIHASAIIQYSAAIEAAVRRMQMSNDCADEDISFYKAGVTNASYLHSPAEDDKCRVYESEGGGIEYSPPNADWFTEPSYATISWGWHVDANHCFKQVGSYAPTCVPAAIDLNVNLIGLRKDVCMAINDRLGVTNPNGAPPTDGNSASGYFNGVYGPSGWIEMSDTAELTGKKAFCMQDIGGFSDQLYMFMHVLIAR